MDRLLETHDVAVRETASANKLKLEADDALNLAREANKIIIAKGKKVVTFDMKRDRPDDDILLKHLLGPTGKLRAPTLKRGKTLIVGFNEEEYNQLFQS